MRVLYILFFLFPFHGINSFQVKVLLAKIPLNTQYVEHISSDHGFIISSDMQLSKTVFKPESNLEITVKSGVCFLNGKQILENFINIIPAFSEKQHVEFKQLVDDWFEENMQDVSLLSIEQLHAFFDLFVKTNVIDSQKYTVVEQAVKEIVLAFFYDVFSSNQNSELIIKSVQSLLERWYTDEKIKYLFLNDVAQEQLDKKNRKELLKNKQFRYDFFESKIYAIAHIITDDLMHKIPRHFVRSLTSDPVNIISFQENQYVGSFILFKQDNDLLIVNSLDIDDYLYSVIKHEGWPGWPHEMNKVLAIICRTYLIWQILQAKKIDRPYHIQNDIYHQTYKGHHEKTKLKQAIDETKNIFVGFNNKPALTMYDACCGGIVPANVDDVDLHKFSYLSRHYPCTFCKNFKIFNWHTQVLVADLLESLRQEYGAKISKIISVAVHKKDKAGLVKSIVVNVGFKKITIPEKKIRKFFPNIRSFLFSINMHDGKKINISGSGYGHHKGLCQWGAYKLIKDDGWSVEQVLQFYYPGTNLMKLTYQL